ncbi:hypothetical protein ACFWVC_26955 [Streptomyces sp. NPDC058691]|uniref:hypothetical protein n=1 Tax=Streptomyces sp. NPDC058691 TaxID=3346601 RepID=UPI0036539B96
MTGTSTLMPLPPYPGLDVTDIVARHDVTGADVRNATALVNQALDAAFEPDPEFVRIDCVRGLTREQFTQLACSCFYGSLFEIALIAKSLWLVTNDMHVYVGQISR